MTSLRWRHAPFFLLLVLGWGSVAAAPALRIRNAWIEEGPPGMDMLAGYLDIENPGDRPLAIQSVHSDAAARIGIHRTELHNGVASMTPVPVLVLPPHSRLRFKPGGYHLMLMGLRSPLRAGDSVNLVLTLKGGRSETVRARVRRFGDNSK